MALFCLCTWLASVFLGLLVYFYSGLLCDLLWSDPEKEIAGWGENDRGVSFTFGQDVVHNFLRKHDLDLICRAHQVSQFFSPFVFFARRQPSGLPLVLVAFCYCWPSFSLLFMFFNVSFSFFYL